MPRPGRIRRSTLTTLVTVALAMVTSGCSGAPDRGDFIAKTKDTVGSDLVVAMKQRGISKADADVIIDTFIGCEYDALKSDVDLLTKAYDDPANTTISADIDARTAECVANLTAAMTAKADPFTATTLPPLTVPSTIPATTIPATTTIVPTTIPATTIG